MNKINVVSLFDGMSCGQIALNRAGFDIENYYASEIEKLPIQVAKENFPETKHIGDVRKLNLIPKGFTEIDFLIGGSPCQSFSFNGKMNGMSTTCDIEILSLEHYLQLRKDKFSFTGQSYLFWEYVRVLKLIKPKYFLLENVRMSDKWADLISEVLGVEYIKVNSSSVCAQNRVRYYWTNVELPKFGEEDSSVLLSDIIESNPDPKYLVKNRSYWNLQTKTNKGTRIECLDKNYRYGVIYTKGPTIVSTITNDTPSGVSRQADRIYSIDGKSPCLTTSCDIKINCGSEDPEHWRYLTPLECERLQTVPEGYTSSVSDNAAYKMLGNGWTIDVLVKFFQNVHA